MIPARLSLVLVSMAFAGQAIAQTPLPNAHAHNDYLHDRPLLDALDAGFCSIEVDVWLVEGALLVAHDKEDLVGDRTLEALYLRPLAERVKANGGRVYADGPELVLLIDIKSRPTDTYEAIEATLQDYRSMLAAPGESGAVRAIISGGRPRRVMLAQPDRLTHYDGRIPELDDGHPATFMPLVSASWTRRYPEAGGTPLSEEVRADVRALTDAAHKENRKFRFWATPEDEDLWTELRALGVDFINTDDLTRLQAFFAKHGAGAR